MKFTDELDATMEQEGAGPPVHTGNRDHKCAGVGP